MVSRVALLRAACVAGCLALGSRVQAEQQSTSVDVSGAIKVALPRASNDAAAFKTADGKAGWVRQLSGETIPTPAYAKGKIFTGGGMGSRTFFAIDAVTGRTLWSKATQDNGPTSAVVTGRFVCYNTESCHTETRDIDSGDLVWSEVTGGTLLTQPVAAGDLLVIPHPTMARNNLPRDDAFRMLTVDITTGKHVFDQVMTGDVFAAPVFAANRVFFACTDGRIFCQTFGAGEGWHVVAEANSAPVVVGNELAVSTDTASGNGVLVGIRRYKIQDGTSLDDQPLAPTLVSKAQIAKTGRAEWDYQGPKVVARGVQLFNAPGRVINSVDATSGAVRWRDTITGGGLSNAVNATTPPALGKSNLYVGTMHGHILALRQSDGGLVHAYNLGVPLASPPILAGGRIYFGTANGLLVCMEIDADADHWTAWGGDEHHNKVD